MARGLVNDELKMIWEKAIVDHEKKKSLMLAIIAGDSKQALPHTSVQLPQHYLLLLEPSVRYCPCGNLQGHYSDNQLSLPAGSFFVST
jgi:hypothetical protein